MEAKLWTSKLEKEPNFKEFPQINPFYGPHKTLLPHVKELDKIKTPNEVPYKNFKAGL